MLTRLPEDLSRRRLSVVAISGNVRRPSRTAGLVSLVVDALSAETDADILQFDMVEVAPVILSALTRADLLPAGLDYVLRLEAADIVVLGSPIYRATYTGAMKHLFDLVDYRALRGAVGIAAATGGVPLHAASADHAIRDLCTFFGMTSVPSSLFAAETDFDGTTPRAPDLHARAARAAQEAVAIARACRRHRLSLAVPA